MNPSLITKKQLQEILAERLADSFPEEKIILGKNWELLARIFYDVGYNDCLNDKAGI